MYSVTVGRPKTDTAVGLSLYSKLDGVFVLELGQDATVSGDFKAHQGTKGDLHNELSSDKPNAWIERPTT